MDDDVVAAAAALPSPWSLLQGLLALLIAWGSYQVAETFWLRPRRLDRALRAQGLTGTEYCFPAGDLKENARLNDEARSRSMPLCHDVVPRVMPHLFNTVKEHGMSKVTTRPFLSSRSCRPPSLSPNSLVSRTPLPHKPTSCPLHQPPTLGYPVSSHASPGMTSIYRPCRVLDRAYAGLCQGCLLVTIFIFKQTNSDSPLSCSFS
jgi:hypothetical protein